MKTKKQSGNVQKSERSLQREIMGLRIELAARQIYSKQDEWVCRRIKKERLQLDTILNNLPNGVSIISDDFEVLYQNLWLNKHVGYRKHKKCFQHYMNRKDPCPDCYIRRAIEKKQTVEGELRAKDGRCYEVIAAPMGSFDGKPAGLEILVDISARKCAERELLATRQRYAELVENLNVGVYRSTPGPQGKFIDVNPEMLRMFEAESKAELLGLNVNRIYRLIKRREEISRVLIKEGSIKNARACFVTLRGRPFWASVTATRKENQAGEVFFDGILEEIDEQRRPENERRAENIAGECASGAGAAALPAS